MALSRRRFLTQTARLAAGAALSAPYVVPGSVFGADAPSNRVTIGMIGVGRQAFFANLPPFLHFEDTQVVAVCDVDSRRLDKAKQETEKFYAGKNASGTFKGCSTFRDFRELLARPDIDAVMISTPDHWHVPMALAAARAGKDIALEKPITMSIDEGRLLSDTVRRYGRVFRTDSEVRSQWFFHRAAELVRNGRIGKLHTIRTGVPRDTFTAPAAAELPVPEELDYDMWLGPAAKAPYTENRVHPRQSYERPGWMRVRDYCDGMICNWGTHLNDIAQWGNNTERTGPVEIEAHGTYPPFDGLWNVVFDFEAWYRFANGVQMYYTMSRPYVRFEGDQGWVEADWSKNTLAAQPESLLKEQIGSGGIHFPLKTEKRDFIDCIKTRGRTLADAEVGHRTTSLCHLAHISIQLGGQRLKWDPDKEVFADNEFANRLTKRSALRAPWTL
ncbi:MAG: Gfo/Idh/MocA family oxidoreductase [Planctomycetota bacterium]|nr:Gfo/Idh/MocA family oxidoreductase [Planctomycetota bacterium]